MKICIVLLLVTFGAEDAALLAQQAGTFISTGNMIIARTEHSSTLLTNGKVLIVGGRAFLGPGNALASAELYDPTTGKFSATGSMHFGRAQHSATLLPDGKVLIAGGFERSIVGGTLAAIGATELYDPSTGSFALAAMTYTPRWGHSAVLLSDGRVLIAGGWNGENAVLSAEIYDYSTDSFSPASNLDEWSEQGVLLADGTVLLGLKLYDPVSGTFSQLAGYTPEGGAGTSLLLDGTVLVTGGGDTDPGISLATAELYDPSAGKYIATGDMTRCRFWHESSLLPDGSVLITGGDGFYCPADPFNYTTLASAEIYQPSTKAFTTAGYMTMARQGHTATLLNDGRVLIAGGFNQHGPSTGIVVDVLASAELYTPPVLVPPPVLLSLSGDGRGQGAILHASTQQLVSADNPAVAGELLEIYLTGLADLSVIPPQVAIGGRMAQVVWFGKAPGFDGLNQVNVRVPSGVISGSSSVPVRLNYIGRPSNEVTITVTMIGPLAAKQ